MEFYAMTFLTYNVKGFSVLRHLKYSGFITGHPIKQQSAIVVGHLSA
jgi:hypothetical protein